MLLNACSLSYRLDDDDPKNIFLERNFPKVKTARDDIAFQIDNTNVNIGNLIKLKRTFKQEESKKVVQHKINQLSAQRDALKTYLNKIDVELEKGMAMQAINDIDGGGLRIIDLNLIIEDADIYIRQARDTNDRISREYNGVVRAVPVN